MSGEGDGGHRQQRRAYVALGANLGDPLAQLRAAALRLTRLGRLLGKSPLYETEPVGGPAGQPPYLNAVALLAPAPEYGEPRALLKALLEIERALGRERRERWGPRLIDLDLLDVGGVVTTGAGENGPALELPHPRLAERAFVLAPLCDLDPDWRHPLLKATACELLAGVGAQGVRRAQASW